MKKDKNDIILIDNYINKVSLHQIELVENLFNYLHLFVIRKIKLIYKSIYT